MLPVPGSGARLCDEAGDWRRGTVFAVAPAESSIECLLAPPSWWGSGVPQTRLAIRLSELPKGRSRVEVEETGLPADSTDGSPSEDARVFWHRALERLRDLCARIKKRRENPRQAVVVIHGIGEQEPGATLKSFVSGSLKTEGWLKPDRASRIFEMRSMTLKAGDRQLRPRTEVYELYWAHLIQDTNLTQVVSWIRDLLFRRRVPDRFVDAWYLAWGAILGIVALAVARAVGWWQPQIAYLVSGGIVALAATALWRLLGKSFVLGSLGDAARYLTPRPANIEKRQAIREAGVDLLEALHTRGDLDRIVIVGHSLGSVIAYDVITHFWIRAHRRHLRLPRVRKAGIEIGRSLHKTGVKKVQKLQHEAWKMARANSQPWLITDLVTLGSPLSAAEFLMARSPEEFKKRQTDREFPTCPPVCEERTVRQGKRRFVCFDAPYDDRFGGKDRSFSFFHHAAPFAVTRWTNLHFPSRLHKDPVGGPVKGQFGAWVRDVPLEAPVGHPRFLHCRYWQPSEQCAEGSEVHIQALHDALGLECGRELLAEMSKHSPLMYLPTKLDAQG